MRLSAAAAITHGTLRGADRRFGGVTIDSRRIAGDDLFVAIAGEQRDGHDFIREAGDHGAVGALVSNEVSNDGMPQIKVRDTTAALGQLGADWRSRFTQPLVAVTGSNGKTTVTSLIAAIFKQRGDCLSPRASFNNQWGVPLTLLRMREHHTHAVIEMGMNRRGEIRYLSGLARPDIALINNVGAAHLAGFAAQGVTDLQGVADAKAEIFSGLAADGCAVLNADDSFYQHWRQRIDTGGVRVLSFGIREAADVMAADISVGAQGSEFELRIGEAQNKAQDKRARVHLPILGRHNVLNATAAAAVATAAGIGIAQIKAGLESFAAIDGRLRPRIGLNGALVIDDSYNANPASVKAALEVLAGFDGERIAVCGAMAELGEQSESFHYEVGAYAQQCGIQHLLCLGHEEDHATQSYVRGFGSRAKHFTVMASLLEHLEPLLAEGVTVLVKGSRAAAMERVVAGLMVKPKEDSSC